MKEEEMIEKTIRVDVSFTGYVTIWKKKKYNNEDEKREDIEQQIKEMKIGELIEETDTFEIEDWKEV